MIKKPPRRDLMLFDQEVDHVFIWIQQRYLGNVFGRASTLRVEKAVLAMVVVLLGLWGGRDKKKPLRRGV